MPKKLTQEEFIQRAKAKHGDKYDYSKAEYINTRQEVRIICPIHGEFMQKSRLHLDGHGCPICGHDVRRKPIYGVGILDISGGRKSKAYEIWASILQRCYDNKWYLKRPTYKGCIICDEWRLFSNFKQWFENPENGYQEGYHIDKDIINKGNKTYSPETCCFVPCAINNLIVSCKSKRGDLPMGVSRTKRNLTKPFEASLGGMKNHIHLGRFSTPEEAFYAYKQAKEQYIQEVATKYFNEGKITERVYNALMRYEVEITD